MPVLGRNEGAVGVYVDRSHKVGLKCVLLLRSTAGTYNFNLLRLQQGSTTCRLQGHLQHEIDFQFPFMLFLVQYKLLRSQCSIKYIAGDAGPKRVSVSEAANRFCT